MVKSLFKIIWILSLPVAFQAVPLQAASKYQEYFDDLLSANGGSFAGMASNMYEDPVGCAGDAAVLGYITDSLVAMSEGTGDPSYILTALPWVESMMSAASIANNGYREWPGSWNSPYNPAQPTFFQCTDFLAGAAMMSIARAILTNPNLTSYHVRAQAVRDFVAANVVDKWMSRGTSWASYDGSADVEFGDRIALWGEILSHYLATASNSKYSNEFGHIVNAFNQRLCSAPSTYCPVVPPGTIRVQDPGSSDNANTSHANFAAHFAMRAYRDGWGVTLLTLQGMAAFFNQVLWNQSFASPAFFICMDGTNNYSSGICSNGGSTPFRAVIYLGFNQLSSVDGMTLSVVQAVLDAIIAGDISNPSLEYMNNVAGQMELAGNLVEALSISSGPQPIPTPVDGDSQKPSVSIVSPLDGSTVFLVN